MFVVVFVLIAIGFATGVGAYTFFRLAEVLNSLAHTNTIAIPIFAMLSVVIPYLISRSAGFLSWWRHRDYCSEFP
jgi:hypothetical protein